MTKRPRTKDESFMIRLYEETCKLSDDEATLDRYHIGRLIGIQKTAVDTICNLLAQANFIKKISSSEIKITPHGIKLVTQLTQNIHE